MALTREEIEDLYSIKDGKILDKGIFEDQPLYIVYYLDLALEGFYEQKNEKCITMTIEPEDRKEFTEIPKARRYFALFQREDGSWYIK